MRKSRFTEISGRGDVQHSQADIGKTSGKVLYVPEFRIYEGIAKAMPWYLEY